MVKTPKKVNLMIEYMDYYNEQIISIFIKTLMY